MRAALITNCVPPYRVPMYERLGERLGSGFRVLSLSRMEQSRDWREHASTGFDYTVLPGYQKFFFRADWALHLNGGLFRELARHRPDVIVTSGYDALAYWASLAYPVRRVLWNGSHRRSVAHAGRVATAARRYFVGRCDAYFTYGTLAAEFLWALGAERERTIIGTNAVDSGAFLRGPERRDVVRAREGWNGRVVVMFSGRLMHKKGIELLVESFAGLPSQCLLVFVGDGPMRGEYESVASGRFGDRVRFLGAQPYDQLPELYAAADVLVLPSRTEVWGLVINEALAAGTAVVASSATGAAHDLIAEKGTGRVFQDGSVPDLQRCLAEVVGDADLRRAMGDAGRALVKQLDTARYADRLCDAMALALSSPRRPHRATRDS